MKNNIPNDVAETFFRENIENATRTTSGYVGRCPACGDSQKNSSKKRLYLLHKPDRGWGVYCHNCELAQSLYYFVQDYFPHQFTMFRSNCLRDYIDARKPTTEEKEDALENKLLKALQKKRKNKKVATKEPVKKKTEIEKFYESCISLTEEQMQYFRDRKLSDKVLNSLRYCKDISDKKYFGYKNRVIIPFFNDNNEVFFFQARATIKDQDPKYINWKGLDHKPEYNEFEVDRTKPTYIVEGLFDSTFVDNSVSTLGVKFSYEKLVYLKEKYPKGIYCLDNDKDGIYWSKMLLKKNYTCLVFPSRYKDLKDLNDICEYEDITNLTSFVEENTYKGVRGLMKLQQLMRS